MNAEQKLAKMARDVADITKDGELDFIIEEVPKIIQRRTRLGKGTDGAELSPLKKLSEGYIKYRKKHKSELSKNTTPNKSNLTATGQLLDSITGSRQGTKFVFTFKDSRRASSFGSSGISNSEVAEYVRKGGRPFFKLSKSERDGLQKRVATILKRAVRKIVNK